MLLCKDILITVRIQDWVFILFEYILESFKFQIKINLSQIVYRIWLNTYDNKVEN